MKIRRSLLWFTILSLLSVAAELSAEKDEEERIWRRQEWFFSSRRDGATEPLNILRWKGFLHTQNLIRTQTSPQGPNIWTSRGPSPSNFSNWAFGPVSGRIIALAKDWGNNILYAGAASGGLWKSTDDGSTWSSIFDGAGTTTVGVITIDPNNAQILWAGTGENSGYCDGYFGIGLLRSTDGGVTWQQRNGSGGSSLQNLSAFASVIVDRSNSNHIVAGGRFRDCVNGNFFFGGLYTSTDAGASWTPRISNAGVSEIVQDPANVNVYWAATENLGLYKSTDGGTSWTLQTASGLPSGAVGRSEVAIAPSNSNYVYTLFANVGGSPQFWRTTNGGTSWSLMSSGSNACDGQCHYNMVVRIDVSNPDTVLRGTIHIFKSTNGGTSWTDLSGIWGNSQKVHQDTHDFLMDPGNANVFYVGCDGGIWKTSNGGSTFVNRNGNLNVTQFYAIGNHPTNDQNILGGAQDNSSLVRTSTDLWEVQQVTGDGFVCHFNPTNPNTVYIAGYPDGQGRPQVFRSVNGVFGPFTYISGAANGIAAGRSNWVTPYLMDSNNPSILYIGTYRVYKSIDSGSNWTAVGPPDLTGGGSQTISALEVNRSNGNYVFAGTTDGRLWRTTDSGLNWTDITAGLPIRYINDIGGDPATPARAFAAIGGFGTAHLYEHTGSGTWIPRGGGLPNVPANTISLRSSSEIYVGTDVGIYVSTDGGLNFTPFMNGLPQGTVVTDLKFSSVTQTLTAATYGRGAWQYTFGNQSCTYPDGGLTNGVVVNDSITCATSQAGWKYYSFTLPSGSTNLVTDLFNLTADVDLYLRFGSKPDLNTYDCRPFAGGTTSEQCNFPSPTSGTWWAGVNNFATGTINYSVRSSWTSPCPTITLSPASLPDGTVGLAYSQNITASGGTAPYSFAVTSGSLPPGLTLNPSGTLSGNPTTAGTYNFPVTGTDSNTCTGFRNYSITISGGGGGCTFADTVLTNGVAVNDSITCGTQQAGWKYYSFTLTSGNHLVADLYNLTADVDLYIRFGAKPDLTNFDCRPFLAGTSSEQCKVTSPAVGTWWIGVNNFNTGTINYSVRATESTTTCLFCDDFENGILALNWLYLKGFWSEASGSLNGFSTRKAIVIATPAFNGCSTCSVSAHMSTAGGTGNKLSLFGWYIDKFNNIELMMKEESNRWILKQRIFGIVVSKSKGISNIIPGVSYDAKIVFDGFNYTVLIDGVPLFSTPAVFLPFGTVGFQTKGTIGSFGDINVN